MAQTTPNQIQNITSLTVNLNIYILNSIKQTKNLIIDDNKHNPQAKLPVLNWHNQNPNITIVEMLTMVPQ